MKKLSSFFKLNIITNEKVRSAVTILQKDMRLRKFATGLGFLFALSWVFGNMLQRNNRTFRTTPEWLEMLLAVAFMTIVSSFAISLIFLFFIRLREGQVRSRIAGKEYRDRSVFLFYTAAILLCWLPVFLAYYPSVFAYDAEGQLYQVIAHDYNTHHPLIHTLFLGAFFELGGRLTGSYSVGMALHSIAQMIIMALIFGYAMLVLYREKTSWVMRLILLVFYALFPTNSILALSTTKDVLFSGLVLLYTIKLYQWSNGRHGKLEESAADSIAINGFACVLVIVSTLMLLFRNNAVYAFLLSQFLVFLWWIKRRKTLKIKEKADISETQSDLPKSSANMKVSMKKYALIVLASLLLFGIGSKGLKMITSAQNGSPREMLSVPLQQMARTRVLHEEEITPDMQAQLDAYLPSEWVFAAYNPYLADPVKNRAVIHDNPVGLIKTWVRLGLQFPMTYIDAFLDNSIGYWYLADKTHSTIYGIGTESGFGYLSTDNRTMPAGCEIIEHSFLPGLRVFLERIVSDNEYQKIPILSVIFAPAFYWWLLCLYITFFLYRKEYKMLLPVLFLAAYYLTLLLSPTVLIRYMYPFAVNVPMMLCLISAEKEKIYKNRQ